MNIDNYKFFFEGDGVARIYNYLNISSGGLSQSIQFEDNDGYHAVTVEGYQDGAPTTITFLEYFGGGIEMITTNKLNKTYTVEAVDADGIHTVIIRRWDEKTQKPFGPMVSCMEPCEPLYSAIEKFSNMAELIFGEVRKLLGRPPARKPGIAFDANGLS